MTLRTLHPRNWTTITRGLLDRFHGLDFLSNIEPEEVGLDPKLAVRCSPSGNKYLAHLLEDFSISSQDTIIDIGCGKGSAMRTMLKFPFAKVDGLEVSSIIADIAKQNFKRLNEKRTCIFTENAATFTRFDKYNLIYLYNPFACSIMTPFIEALVRSLHKLDRELIIIYNNAMCSDEIVSSGVFKKIGIYPDEFGKGIIIYSNRDFNNSRLSKNKRMQLIN